MNKLIVEYQTRSHVVLEQALNNEEVPERLRDAMRYSALAGGKRFRAMLVYAAGIAVNAPLEKLDIVAAAIECIHAYSLIHDDLPAMDDDDLRRGQATNHIKFDEATAILSGDGLLTFAFELINQPTSPLNDTQCRKISHQLSLSSGPSGMVGGQMLDIQATEKKIELAQLENIHKCKTGALINASVISGALCCDTLNSEQLANFSQYANAVGLAFQVVDDILDIESSTEELGKRSGADIALGKATYPSLIGLEKSKLLAQNLYQEAIACVRSISDNNNALDDQEPNNMDLLINLADLVVKRKS